jgi:hypothetical protein
MATLTINRGCPIFSTALNTFRNQYRTDVTVGRVTDGADSFGRIRAFIEQGISSSEIHRQQHVS